MSDVQRLYQVIQSSAEITSYVRELLICEGMIGREWIAGEKTLPLLLEKLTNIQKFQLERSASMRITWRDVPPAVKASIGGVLASPSLLELKLVGLVLDHPTELLRILQSCRILRNLHVEHLLLPEGSTLDTGSIPQKQQRAPLDVLTIGARTSTALIGCLLHPESTIDVTALRKLSVSISGSFSDFARLLRATSSLEVLEIVLMNDSQCFI